MLRSLSNLKVRVTYVIRRLSSMNCRVLAKEPKVLANLLREFRNMKTFKSFLKKSSDTTIVMKMALRCFEGHPI